MDFVGKASRDQIKMVCLADFVPLDSAARQIDKTVEDMDTSYFVNSQLNAEGRPPYNPKDMLKLLIYGMENGIVSSRKLKRECTRNMELRWLIGELVPDAKTISDFRKNNATNMTRFFNEFAKKMCKGGYADGKLMAIDGTKIRASNSKRNNFSAKKLDAHIEYINQKIAEYQNELDKNDRIEALEERKAKYKSFKEKIDSGEVSEVSVTDPDSRLMKQGNNGVDVSYNVQTVVDAKNKLVVGMSITSSAADQGQLGEVMPKVKEELELEEVTVLADKGYYKTEDFKICEDNNITTIVAKSDKAESELYDLEDFIYDEENDVYICPGCNELYPGKEDEAGYKEYKNNRACKNCPNKPACTKGTRRVIKRHKYKASAEQNDKRYKENKKLYRKRQELVEHPFGTIKRTMGIRQFQTRGKEQVAAEMALILLTYNLKRLRVIHKRSQVNEGICLLFGQFMLKIQEYLNTPTNPKFF